jgi:hypothetical protein
MSAAEAVLANLIGVIMRGLLRRKFSVTPRRRRFSGSFLKSDSWGEAATKSSCRDCSRILLLETKFLTKIVNNSRPFIE